MSIEPTITKVYKWSDVQNELCRIMVIPEDMFRDYHKVVGGKYKDFWHVCLKTIIPESMANGSTVTMFPYCDEPYEGDDAWKNVVLDAWNKLYDQLDESGTESGIEVSFFW